MTAEENAVFVFGSNEAGRHGLGAAKFAHEHKGAIMGKGFGHYGNSFAIPTKDTNIETLGLRTIRVYIDRFLRYAAENPQLQFKVTQIGCGLAGIKAEDIAPLFVGGQKNVFYDEAWKPYLKEGTMYWGTFND